MKTSGSRNANNKARKEQIKFYWAAWIALFTVALLYEALPKVFYWGPRGLMIGLVVCLTIPLIITHWRQHSHLSRILNLSINVLITVYMIMSVSRLVIAAFGGTIGPNHLLLSAVILWVTNVLIFALWYWSLDAGGPGLRAARDELGAHAFLFPQMQISVATSESRLSVPIKNWRPIFVDYLFLSFNTSAAFSPTDTPILDRWAKGMSMIQALLSLTIVIMLAARAINILAPATRYLVS